MGNWINVIPVVMILAASLAILVMNEWRYCLVALSIIYLGMFILLVQILPLTLASAKLITGWMAALLLALNQPKQEIVPDEGLVANRIFKIFTMVLIWVIALLIANPITVAFGVRPENAFAAVAIFGCGLMVLGMKFKPHFIILGILTLLAGFETLYSSIEISVLVNGLLAVINLLIAFIGSFFVEFSHEEQEP